MPVKEVVRTQPRNLLVAIGARFSENGNSYLFNTFALTYITAQLALPENVGLYGVLIASALGLLTIPAYGALSDRVGRRPLYLAGAAFVALFASLLLDAQYQVDYLDLAGHHPEHFDAVGIYAMFSPQAAYFAELFDTRVRYSGISACSRDICAVSGRDRAVHRYGAAREHGQLLGGRGVHDRTVPDHLGLRVLGPETYRRGMTRESREEETVRPEPALAGFDLKPKTFESNRSAMVAAREERIMSWRRQ